MKYFLSFWNGFSKKTQWIHLLCWIIGLSLINIPELETTLGLFHAHNYSLLFPSIYGVFINMIIFYGNAQLLNLLLRKEPTKFWIESAKLFSIACFAEAIPDIIYYYFFYSTLTTSIAWEIFIGTFLMNGLFFYIPSFILGFARDWRNNKPSAKSDRINIKSGTQSFMTASDEILYIESDGNYCTYITSAKPIVVRKSLTQILHELPDNFIQCHKSFVVNANLIDKLTYDKLQIEGFSIPIGRKYRNEVKDTLDNVN